MELSVGEALTSFLDEQGVPTIVQRTKIVCPQSLMGAPEPMARMKAMLHDGMEKSTTTRWTISPPTRC